MHTFLTRANALAAYTMSVLAGLTMICFLSTFFLDYRTGSKINTVKVVVKHVPDYSASREKVIFLILIRLKIILNTSYKYKKEMLHLFFIIILFLYK